MEPNVTKPGAGQQRDPQCPCCKKPLFLCRCYEAGLTARAEATANHSKWLREFRAATPHSLAVALLVFLAFSSHGLAADAHGRVASAVNGVRTSFFRTPSVIFSGPPARTLQPSIRPRKCVMDDPAQRHRRVLTYLSDMMEYCRLLHRHDLESEYKQAWETAAEAIYGPLPQRPPNQVVPYPTTEQRPRTWFQKRSAASPYRKIIARMDDYEVLECGHRIWRIAFAGDAGKRRRCTQCLDSTQVGALALPRTGSSQGVPDADSDSGRSPNLGRLDPVRAESAGKRRRKGGVA